MEGKHTIRISEDLELSLKIPEIMDLEDLYGIVDKVDRLKEPSKVVNTNPVKETAKEKPSKTIDMKNAVKEYMAAPFGKKQYVAEKYGIHPDTLKWNVRDYKNKRRAAKDYTQEENKPEVETKSNIIMSDLWKDYLDAPFGQKESVAEKYGITLQTLRTYIHTIKKKMGTARDYQPKSGTNSNKKYSDELVADIVRLIKAGLTTREVAVQKGMKRQAVNDLILQRAGKGVKELQQRI